MDSSSLQKLRTHFETVTSIIAGALSGGSSHVLALVAKWEKTDLVPGLSDLDLRVICDDSTTADDWLQIDRISGRIHLEMVRANPQWNRINEHTPGAGMTVSEVMDARFHNPEYAVWSLWWGEQEWFDRLKAEMVARDFGAVDEHYHLSKFLDYYSPYIHGIDPPINLGLFEPKYPLHSRCWHYFAPPILSAASLLARRNFSGKWEGLTWLRDNGYVARQVDAVLEQVDAHYETPEQTDTGSLQAWARCLAIERLVRSNASVISVWKSTGPSSGRWTMSGTWQADPPMTRPSRGYSSKRCTCSHTTIGCWSGR